MNYKLANYFFLNCSSNRVLDHCSNDTGKYSTFDISKLYINHACGIDSNLKNPQ